MKNVNEIDPKILHKDHVDDVLIFGDSQLLPSHISLVSIHNFKILLSEEELSVIEKAYFRHEDHFVLRTIPFEIEPSDEKVVSIIDVEISEYYSLNNNKYQLESSWLPLQVEALLHRGYLSNIKAIDHEERESITSLFAKYSPDLLLDVHTYQMYNNMENYFFYRKHHEHVPGLMLIEVARQSMYHHFYAYSGFFKGQVSISISSLNNEFFNYTEPSYPVEVVVFDTKKDRNYKPRSVDKTAVFYQKGKSITEIRLQGPVVKMSLFKRMRSINIPEDHWFRCSSKMSNKILLQSDCGFEEKADIVNISLAGVKVRFPATTKLVEIVRFGTLFVEDFGFITVPIEKIDTYADQQEAYISFGELNIHKSRQLREVLKQYCFYCDEQVTLPKNSEIKNISNLAVKSV